MPDRTKVIVSSNQPVKISTSKFRLEAGIGSVVVGPSTEAGDVLVDARDFWGKMPRVSVKVRFVLPGGKVSDAPKAPPPLPAPVENKFINPQAEEVHTSAEKKSVWRKIKSVLGF
jgi:hypothetical protein